MIDIAGLRKEVTGGSSINIEGLRREVGIKPKSKPRELSWLNPPATMQPDKPKAKPPVVTRESRLPPSMLATPSDLRERGFSSYTPPTGIAADVQEAIGAAERAMGGLARIPGLKQATSLANIGMSRLPGAVTPPGYNPADPGIALKEQGRMRGELAGDNPLAELAGEQALYALLTMGLGNIEANALKGASKLPLIGRAIKPISGVVERGGIPGIATQGAVGNVGFDIGASTERIPDVGFEQWAKETLPRLPISAGMGAGAALGLRGVGKVAGRTIKRLKRVKPLDIENRVTPEVVNEAPVVVAPKVKPKVKALKAKLDAEVLPEQVADVKVEATPSKEVTPAAKAETPAVPPEVPVRAVEPPAGTIATPAERPGVLYHGGFDLGEQATLKPGYYGGEGERYTGSDSGAVFFTPSQKYARQYSRTGRTGESGLYEYSLSPSDEIFDATNPEHLTRLAKVLGKDAEYVIPMFKETTQHGAADWATASQYIEEIESAGFTGAKFLERPAEDITQLPDGSFDLQGPPVYSYAMFGKEYPVKRVASIPEPSAPSVQPEPPPAAPETTPRAAEVVPPGEGVAAGGGKAKEPWEVTRDEYALSQVPAVAEKSSPEWQVEVRERAKARGEHRKSVELALSEGRAVQPRVANEYPDLQQKYSKAQGEAAVGIRDYVSEAQPGQLTTEGKVVRKTKAEFGKPVPTKPTEAVATTPPAAVSKPAAKIDTSKAVKPSPVVAKSATSQKPAPTVAKSATVQKPPKPAPTPTKTPTLKRVQSVLKGMSTVEIKDAFDTGVADQYLKKAGWKPDDIAKARAEITGKAETPGTFKVTWESETTSQTGDLGKTFTNEAAAKIAAADAKRKNPGRTFTVEEAEPSARSHIMEGLDAAEEAVLSRIRARKQASAKAIDRLGGKKGQGGFAYNPIEDFADAVELGAIKIAKGTVRLAEFTAEMVKHYGDEIRPYVKKVYAAARKSYGRDYGAFDQALQPLGIYDWQGKPIQKGVVDRLGTIINKKGELENVGSKAGQRIRQAERDMTRHTNQALRTINRIVTNIIAGVPGKLRAKAFSDFIDLIEKPFEDAGRIAAKAADTAIGKALRLHDSMTERFRQYIIDSRKSQGIDTPDNWGITEQGYFRHLFLGDFEVRESGQPVRRANTYAEAQGIVHKALKANPDAKITVTARNMVFGDPTLRVSTGRYFRIAGNLSDSVKIPLSEVMADIRGEIGRKAMKQKWSPYTLQRKGAAGFSKEYANVMRMHAAQVFRTQELSKLNHELQPMIEKIRAGGKPGLAEEIEDHLTTLWGTPGKQDKLVGNFIRAHPKLADRIAAPDLAWRGLARRLTALQFAGKLRLSPRAALMNELQPYSTLWPFVSTKQYLSYKVAVQRPSIRKWMENLGVFDEAGKAEKTGLVGVHQKASWVAPWNWFQKVSDSNRAMGFIHGYKTAKAEGATSAQAIANGKSWAEKVEFDNSQWNIQPALRSPAGRVLGQFKSFMGKNLENVREVFTPSQPIPVGQRAGRIAKWTTAQAGIGGVRAFGAAATAAGGYKLYELIKGRLQEAGMNEEDSEKWAQVVYLGAPSLIGQDLSGSVMILEAPYGATTAEKIANAFGPTVGTLAQATDAVAARDWEKLARSFTPATRQVKAAAQILKGDKATIKLGREEQGLSNFEGIMRTLGFTPAKQTMFYEGKEKAWWESPKKKSSGKSGRSARSSSRSSSRSSIRR